MRFLGLSLEDDVPDHSVLSRFRTRLTVASAWTGLLNQVNRSLVISNTRSGVVTTAANCHDSKPLLDLIDKADIQSGTRIHADKACCSQKHRDALKSCGIRNGIQDKATKNNPLTRRQLQRNRLITKARSVAERTFGSQARWLNATVLRYRGLAKAHAWHLLLAMAYHLKRLPKLFVDRRLIA